MGKINLFDDDQFLSIQSSIRSIGYDQFTIISDILSLHAKQNKIDLDPTYSVGNFYKKGLRDPKYKFDFFPQGKDVIQASSGNIPLPDECVNTIMFDPPFLIGGTIKENSGEGSSITVKRFTNFHSFNELKVMYSDSLKEFSRLLKPDGIVIFKCQDTVDTGGNYFTHCWVMQQALKYGFYPKDLFILLARNRLTGHWTTQHHARKYHSYFWVFQKKEFKINYKLKK